MLSIKVKGFTGSDNEITVSSTNSINNNEKPINEINNKIDELTNFMKSNISMIKAPEDFEDTILNDDEINEVLSELLRIQNDVFPYMPMRQDLVKKFMWNIPREVYNAWKDYVDYGEPLATNPLLYFYLFCVDDPSNGICYFVREIMASIDDDTHEHIMNNAEEYCKYYVEMNEEEE